MIKSYRGPGGGYTLLKYGLTAADLNDALGRTPDMDVLPCTKFIQQNIKDVLSEAVVV